ncbi:MAG: SGNH/GDSL hydrolase family protein [bacterium]|nr:SGNH/GDSL hydrolase family protein [bacterium]
MKKYILAIAIITLASLYLYLANAYIYYRLNKAGLKLPVPPTSLQANGRPLYVALGDSLTAGLGAEKYQESFPYLLARNLSGGSPASLRVLAVPGNRSDDLIKNQLEPAIAAQPDIITLLIGTNDIHGFYSREKFKKNYQFILERLAKETKAKVYAISIPWLGAPGLFSPPLNYYFDYKTAGFNKIIKQLAAAYGVEYLDIAAPTRALGRTGGPYYAADSFHPSAAGYALWAELIYNGIKQ